MVKTTNDSNLRAAARRRGFTLIKRRYSYCPGLSNGYMILDSFNGLPVAGERYELSAEEVKNFLNEGK